MPTSYQKAKGRFETCIKSDRHTVEEGRDSRVFNPGIPIDSHLFLGKCFVLAIPEVFPVRKP